MLTSQSKCVVVHILFWICEFTCMHIYLSLRMCVCECGGVVEMPSACCQVNESQLSLCDRLSYPGLATSKWLGHIVCWLVLKRFWFCRLCSGETHIWRLMNRYRWDLINYVMNLFINILCAFMSGARSDLTAVFHFFL